ncbi:hypothetical protein D8S82_17165 [Mycobacterium hodleri]|uniref:Uncharacterized protein n=1 Tax=Mycolicibacterium hodleri TaxID=49897 RepID=A0A544VZE8_9MYCO|nr:hypothetical protein D8S82_17165 [Mycolicibacterium hodleri]
MTTFMCTTHDRIADVTERVRRQPERFAKQTFYPCMPYAHKYSNAMSDAGMFGAIKQFLPDEGFIDAAMRGGKSFATKDVEGIITLLVDAEMKMFHGLETPVIFLQNVVVDFLLGMGFTEAFRIFAAHVSNKYGADPGFITMNMPRLLDALDAVGIVNPIVCSNINKIGFRMSGGVASYIDALENRNFRAVAMSVFASGAIRPDEAIEWVASLPNVESIVFGASSRTNIDSTAELVRKYWPADGA